MTHPAAAKLAQSLFSPPFWKRGAPQRARMNAAFVATAPAESLSATELQARYLPAVLNYAAARLGSDHAAEAEDIAAEVFAAAFTHLYRCPRPVALGSDNDPVRAWLFGVARRRLADAQHRKQRRPLPAPLSDDLAAPDAHGPDVPTLADEAARTLQTILATLPAAQCEALRLKYRMLEPG